MFLIFILLISLFNYNLSFIVFNNVTNIECISCSADNAYYIEDINELVMFAPYDFREIISNTSSNNIEVCITISILSDIICTSFDKYYRIKFIIDSNMNHYIFDQDMISIHWNLYYIDNNNKHKHIQYSNTISTENLSRSEKLLENSLIPGHIALSKSTCGEICSVPQFDAHYIANPISIELGSHFLFEIIGLSNFQFAIDSNYIKLNNIEPGTWFYSLTPIFQSNNNNVIGYNSNGYIEFVLSPEEIIKQRVFSKDYMNTNENIDFNIDTNVNNKNIPLNICIWGSNIMDGQKRIWLQQMESMDSKLFYFIYILSTDNNNNTSNDTKYITTWLRKLPNVALKLSYLIDFSEIDINWLDEDPGDGTLPASMIWGNNITTLYEWFSSRYYAANGIIDNITPLYVKNLYAAIRNIMSDNYCDIAVFGNNRGSNTDFLITQSANSLGIPSIIELLNLFVDPILNPDVIIGPSTYSIQHDSVLNLKNINNKYIPLITKISPAVDLDKFNYNRIKSENSMIKHPNCLSFSKNSLNPCINIGFIGRLSIEKNAGLFFLAAKSILNLYPFARFTIIGDGPLRKSFEKLTIRLKISKYFYFTGWLGDDLPNIIYGLDIVVNPSLRGWAETFCISNIEAMSLGVPIVTFAVGGVGDYIDEPNVNDSMKLYSITNTAIIVNVASIDAISSAVLLLINNSTLRHSIGSAGRERILSYYTKERQMKQYSDLYTFILKKNK